MEGRASSAATEADWSFKSGVAGITSPSGWRPSLAKEFSGRLTPQQQPKVPKL